MHSTQLVIIAIGMALGLAALAYFIRRIILRALRRSYATGHNAGFNLQSKKAKQQREQILALNRDLTRLTTQHRQAIEQAQAKYSLLIQHLTPQLSEFRNIVNGLLDLQRPDPRRSYMKQRAHLIRHTQDLERSCQALTNCVHPNGTAKVTAS